MVQPDLNQERWNPGRPSTLLPLRPLVLIDDQDAIGGPSQGDRVIDEGVLPGR